MRIDVILPTFNRATLLERTLESLRLAERPDGLDVHVLVVDNASTDATRALVHAHMNRFEGRLHYLFEPTPGKPHALNAGIAATGGDLIGLIDDDEEIAADWFTVIRRQFDERPELDFIGGKCLPRWEAPRPEWLGSQYLGVIGWVDPGPQQQVMDERYQGMLMGGNAVIRRRTLERAGPYSAALSRTGTVFFAVAVAAWVVVLVGCGAHVVPTLPRSPTRPRRLGRRSFRSSGHLPADMGLRPADCVDCERKPDEEWTGAGVGS